MTAKKRTPRRGRPVDPNSKLSRAKALFKKSTPRPEMLATFRRRLRISDACAATYYQIARSS